jgi:hypothetical protein
MYNRTQLYFANDHELNIEYALPKLERGKEKKPFSIARAATFVEMGQPG